MWDKLVGERAIIHTHLQLQDGKLLRAGEQGAALRPLRHEPIHGLQHDEPQNDKEEDTTTSKPDPVSRCSVQAGTEEWRWRRVRNSIRKSRVGSNVLSGHCVSSTSSGVRSAGSRVTLGREGASTSPYSASHPSPSGCHSWFRVMLQ